MKRLTAKGIVLTRTDYGEADRIITFLTADHGKVKAIAKGVRKSKAKLAGSVELFGVSDLTMIIGRSEINTLISARLSKNYGEIVKNVERTKAGYEFLRLINKATEEAPEPAYFHLLEQALESLNDKNLDLQLITLWFNMQLLKLSGHSPNLHTDKNGSKLVTSGTYEFHIDHMHFTPESAKQGSFTTNHIKFLRVGFSAKRPQILQRISGAGKLAEATHGLIQTMLKAYVRI